MAIDWTLHLMPVLLMLAIVAFNHVYTHHRTEYRNGSDAYRLRFALASEIRVLEGVYRANIDLISSKSDHLLSVRAPILIYKSNLGRITSLFEPWLIDQLVAIYARNEVIESHLNVHGKNKGGLAYQLAPEGDLSVLKILIGEGLRDIAGIRDVVAAADGALATASARRKLDANQGAILNAD